MRNDIPDNLRTHLDSRCTTTSYCWKVERLDGTVLGFTDHDKTIEFEGVQFKATSAVASTNVQSKKDMSVDNLEVMGALDDDRISSKDINNGLYDAAFVTLYLVNWRDPSQRYIKQKGRIGNIVETDQIFNAEVRGLGDELQQIKGREYSFTCDAKLGDKRCGINLGDPKYTHTDTVKSAYYTHPYPNDYFSRGIIKFNTGANAGVSREIKQDKKGQTPLPLVWERFPSPVAIGDQYTLTVGCDKLYETCRSKFNNSANFRGFPFIPPRETVYKVIRKNSEEVHDGKSLFK